MTVSMSVPEVPQMKLTFCLTKCITLSTESLCAVDSINRMIRRTVHCNNGLYVTFKWYSYVYACCSLGGGRMDMLRLLVTSQAQIAST